ncbi:MAG: hypothetical protein AAGG65_16825 [Pseudomonadota bacterium]
MIAIKIVVTSAMVLGLSWLSERVSPRVAGVFAGFPLGIAVSLFFIGVEQGPQFGAVAATSTIGGLGASLIFCAAYWQFSDRIGRWSVILTSILSLAVFLVAAALIGLLPQNRWLLLAVTLVLTGAAIFSFRRIADADADADGGSGKKVVITPFILVMRAGVATAIVLAITGAASAIGEEWSGLLSGFPITLYPVLLIVHVTYSKREVHGIIKNFPFGIGSLILFALVSSLVVVPLGVYWGTLVAVAVAAVYLACVAVVIWKVRASRLKTDTKMAT